MSGLASVLFWNDVAARWGETIWRAAWQGGLFALLIWAACRTSKRLSPSLRHWLWWLACLKFVVGFCPSFPAFAILPPVSPVRAEVGGSHELPSGLLAAVNATQFQGSEFATAARRVDEIQPTIQPSVRLSATAWLMSFWLLSVGVLTGFSAFSLARLLRRVRRAQPLDDPEMLRFAEEAAQAVGIRAVPRLLVTGEDIGVLTIGALKPVILLSKQALSRCSHAELRLVLAHEFSHIRRGDAWLGLLPQLTQILFCFHPLVWLACRELDLAREAACDEATIRSMHVRSDLYGRLLLKLGVRSHHSWPTLWSPGVSSHFRILHRRISMLAQVSNGSPRRPKGPVALFACLTGIAVTVPWSIVHAQNPAASEARHSAAKPIEPPVAVEGGVVEGKSARKLSPSRQAPAVKTTPATALKLASAGKSSKAARPVAAKTAKSKSGEMVMMKVTPLSGGGGMLTLERETKIVRLQQAQATSVAEMLNTLYEDKSANGLRIIADPRTNSVLLNGPVESILQMILIMNQLDENVPVKNPEHRRQTHVVKLHKPGASQVAETLAKLFEVKSGESPRIVADSSTGTLLIQATRVQFDEIMEAVRVLDSGASIQNPQ